MDPLTLGLIGLVGGIAGPLIGMAAQPDVSQSPYPRQQEVEEMRQWWAPSMFSTAGSAMTGAGFQPGGQMQPFPQVSPPPPKETQAAGTTLLYPPQQGAGTGMVRPEQIFGSLYPGMS